MLTSPTATLTVSREAVAWRKQQIGDCLREGNYDAAQFHYRWLIHDIVTSKPAAEIGK